MTTWIDTPGSELASRGAPTRFMVSSEPSFVSVSFRSGRAEELAYRDGVFLEPYGPSTRQDGMFSLRRTGGWPSAPTVHVQEAAAPGAAVWQKLYEVDFTALPAQANCPPGNYTIDGQTWWVKGNPALSGGYAPSLVPGAGLRITSAFHMCYPSSFYGGTNPYLRWFMPLAQFEGFNEAAPIVLMARLNNSPVTRIAFTGFIDSPNDTAGPTAGAKADHITQAGLGWNGVSAALTEVSFGKRAQAGSTALPEPANLHDVANSARATPNAVVSIFRVSRSAALCAASAWTGSFPTPDAVQISDTSTGTNGFVFRPGAAAPDNLGVTFTAQDQLGNLGAHTYDLMQMCIWQMGSA